VEGFDIGDSGGGESEICGAELFEDGFCAFRCGGGEEGLDRWFEVVYYLEYGD